MQYSSNSYTVYDIWYTYGMIGVVLIMIQFTLKQNILALVGPHVFKYVFDKSESELGRLFDDSKLNHCKRYKYDKR